MYTIRLTDRHMEVNDRSIGDSNCYGCGLAASSHVQRHSSLLMIEDDNLAMGMRLQGYYFHSVNCLKKYMADRVGEVYDVWASAGMAK